MVGKVALYAEAVSHGEIIINATSDGVSLEALNQAGEPTKRQSIVRHRQSLTPQ
jgi:hypothetical protein